MMKDIRFWQSSRFWQESAKIRLSAVAEQVGALICGLLAARTAVWQSALPFGIGAAAGCPLFVLPSVAVGVAIGSFFPAVGSSGFRYLAALFAVLAIRLMLSGYRKLCENAWFCGLIGLLCSGVTTAVTLTGLPNDAALLCGEAVLAGGSAFFVCRAGQALHRQGFALSPEDRAAVLCVAAVLPASLLSVTVFSVSPVRALTLTFLLAAAKYGGLASGAVGGIAFGVVTVLSTGDFSAALFYPLIGLAGGLLSPLGKYAELGGAAACAFLTVATSADGSWFASGAEWLLGALAFVAVPRSAGIFLGKFFSGAPQTVAPSGAKQAVRLRLNRAAAALGDVSQTVEQVSRELGRINAPDFSGVIRRIEADACAGCPQRLSCWETLREETVSALLEMTRAVKNGEYGPDTFAPEAFRGRCPRTDRLGEAVGRHYLDYASRMAAELRLDEVRGVVADQFDGISELLLRLAEGLGGEDTYDNAAALTAASALKNLNLQTEECCAHRDRYGRLTLELKLRTPTDAVPNRMQILKLLSVACERDFAVPALRQNGEALYLTVTERTALRVEIGVAQLAAGGNSLCGDGYRHFYDGAGHFVMILSDGMGTGGRAAVDGAMASGLMARLLKAGIDYDCALKILNSSMLFKSTDESLATLDIASFDLFTGAVELYKAGAAATLVRRNGRIGKAESTSLPIGILREVGFDRASLRLHPGDLLLLLSDGAVGDGTEWISEELAAFTDGKAEDLAERLAEGARRRRTEPHEDDITVMVAVLEKAP